MPTSMDLSCFNERIYNNSLSDLTADKKLIICLNAYSFNIAQYDKLFQNSILKSDVILPDGIAIVYALRYLTGRKLRKISGHELFYYEIEKLNLENGKCFFLGSSPITISLIKLRIAKEYPNVKVDSFSPPYEKEFNDYENGIMVRKVNEFQPDVLFIGMGAPKQEKLAFANFNEFNAHHICCIGAVFDFYAETCKRAPSWMIDMGLEWLHRLLSEPRRLWRRYIFGNPRFISLIIMEKLRSLALRRPKKTSELL